MEPSYVGGLVLVQSPRSAHNPRTVLARPVHRPHSESVPRCRSSLPNRPCMLPIPASQVPQRPFPSPFPSHAFLGPHSRCVLPSPRHTRRPSYIRDARPCPPSPVPAPSRPAANLLSGYDCTTFRAHPSWSPRLSSAGLRAVLGRCGAAASFAWWASSLRTGRLAPVACTERAICQPFLPY